MFYTRKNNITIIAVLDSALPQTVDQCKKTFEPVHGELDWLYTDDYIDPKFSDAYLGDNSYDLNQCKTITKERLRAERKPLLEAEDIKFMQAQESGADTTAIVTEKKRLRDITKSVDSCTTTDELKALNCIKPE